MAHTRRRQLAWLFALVLALELALLCCASAHLIHHPCLGHRGCVLCAFLREGLHRAALWRFAAATLLALIAVKRSFTLRRRRIPSPSLISLCVRLND